MLLRTTALLLFAASLAAAQPTTHRLAQPIEVRHAVSEGITTLRLRARGSLDVDLPFPAAQVAARVVELAGRRVLVVEASASEEPSSRRHALVVDLVAGRPLVRWHGRLDPHGDPGERRRDVLRVADFTGDGVDDLVVGFVEESRTLCGGELLLEPRAVDPRTGELRAVSLRRLADIEGETELRASAEGPVADDAPPLLPGLVAVGASSSVGSPVAFVPPPAALVDGDPTTAWVEGHPGNGQWEAAILRWTARDIRPRHLALVPPPAPAVPPEAIWIVHDGGRLRVRGPDAGGTWWIPLPADLETRCLAIVLDAPAGAPAAAHAGFAEARVYTELDLGGGLEVLFTRVAEGGDQGAESARVLAAVGPRAVTAAIPRWAEMTSHERRALVPMLARALADEPAVVPLLLGAGAADDDALRQSTLEALEAVGPAAHPLLGELATGLRGDEAALRFARAAPTAALPHLLAALDAPSGTQRPTLREALRTAAQRGELSAIDAWLGAAPSAAALAAAAEALSRGGEVLADVAEASFEAGATAAPEDFADRWRLTQAAASLPPSDATRAWLQRAAEADEWMLRAAALRALPRVIGSPARARLRAGLADRYPRVRAAAAEAFGQLDATREDVLELATRARRDEWPLVRAAAVRAIAGHEVARPVVVAALGDRSRKVRGAAIDALREAGVDEAWPRIAARIEHAGEWPEVLAAAIRFAHERCRREGAPELLALVERARSPEAVAGDVELGVFALQALVALGREDVLPTETGIPALDAARTLAERAPRCP
ncbi:MAG: HEAT repeat domain-containing protein [Myxococcales bacterium]|nr:HEAT repeat domain-containing protein [Myxococcales bacterium]